MKVTARAKGRASGRRPNILEIRDAKLFSQKFNGQTIDMFSAIGCEFRECQFEKVTFKKANFGAGGRISHYFDCSFDGARISAIAPGNARFERCQFTNIELSNFIGTFTQFVDCVFSGILTKCVFHGKLHISDQESKGRQANEFSRNNFELANFVDVGFRAGINLGDQKLPLQSDYKLIPNGEKLIQRARERFLQEQDLKIRQKAFSVIRILQYDIDQGQEQLYISKQDFPPALRNAVDLVLAEY